MEFIKRILRRLKPSRSEILLNTPSFESESDYYKWFFIKNDEWNKSTPNFDEEIRWRGIKEFVDSINWNNKYAPSILDLGCGRGWLTNLLNDFGEVTGIEPVEAVVDYGKKLFPSLNILSGDSKFLLEKKFQKNYDLIVSSEVIEHVEQKDKSNFAKNIYDLLKDNGYLIISTPRKEALDKYLYYMKPSQPIEHWMAEKDVQELFIENGFRKLRHQNLMKKMAGIDSALDIYQLWLFQKN